MVVSIVENLKITQGGKILNFIIMESRTIEKFIEITSSRSYFWKIIFVFNRENFTNVVHCQTAADFHELYRDCLSKVYINFNFEIFPWNFPLVFWVIVHVVNKSFWDKKKLNTKAHDWRKFSYKKKRKIIKKKPDRENLSGKCGFHKQSFRFLHYEIEKFIAQKLIFAYLNLS